MTSAFAGTSAAVAADDTNDDWLHAVGSRLYDKDGNEVWLTGANWFGLNCIEYSPHYLYAGDIDDMLSEVADRGINVIRFPVSTELILSWMNGTPFQISSGGMQAVYNPPVDQDDGNGGVVKAGTYGNLNKDFVEADGKTLITSDRGFDIILSKCKKYGIKAFIDIHSPHADNSGHNYNLWYGKETTSDGTMVTTKIWQDTLVWLADKYKNDDTLIGYDLKNEPHGKGQEGAQAAKWDGSTDENNWAYAATNCANAILDVNPNALIFIEGVEQSMSGALPGDYWGMADRRDNSPYIGAWWGGNFRGAKEYPIDLGSAERNSQIVYSPHDYGPSVYAQTWFEKDFTTQTLLDDYWYETWAYINDENKKDYGEGHKYHDYQNAVTAPMLIGEWGGHMDGAENQKWMELLRDYMIDNHINHTFWCLNTNSGDTGGLWKNISCGQQAGSTVIEWEENKYALFEKALWQTSNTGKYIGLDHQIPLSSTPDLPIAERTGLSLTEYYNSYADSEGSNLVTAGKSDPKPPVEVPTDGPDTPTEPAPTESTAAVTTAKVTTDTPKVTETTVNTPDPTEAAKPDPTDPTQEAVKVPTDDESIKDAVWGDINEDTNVVVSDLVLLNRYLLKDEEALKTITAQGLINANVEFNDEINQTDSTYLLNSLSNQISKDKLGKQK
ncbi:MAG: cellulase family glycosylhydrolase [Clostridium sp.]|nr:cellulase family glycosylhydrolase [Clostridium sp.]MCM1547349.1 cellulase family glycosylhydrolase [Ruminococcus sp.]